MSVENAETAINVKKKTSDLKRNVRPFENESASLMTLYAYDAAKRSKLSNISYSETAHFAEWIISSVISYREALTISQSDARTDTDYRST